MSPVGFNKSSESKGLVFLVVNPSVLFCRLNRRLTFFIVVVMVFENEFRLLMTYKSGNQ